MTIYEYIHGYLWIHIAVIIVLSILTVWGFSILLGKLKKTHDIQKATCPEELLYIIKKEEITSIEDVVNLIQLISPRGKALFKDGVKINLQEIPIELRKYLKIK